MLSGSRARIELRSGWRRRRDPAVADRLLAEQALAAQRLGDPRIFLYSSPKTGLQHRLQHRAQHRRQGTDMTRPATGKPFTSATGQLGRLPLRMRNSAKESAHSLRSAIGTKRTNCACLVMSASDPNPRGRTAYRADWPSMPQPRASPHALRLRCASWPQPSRRRASPCTALASQAPPRAVE